MFQNGSQRQGSNTVPAARVLPEAGVQREALGQEGKSPGPKFKGSDEARRARSPRRHQPLLGVNISRPGREPVGE